MKKLLFLLLFLAAACEDQNKHRALLKPNEDYYFLSSGSEDYKYIVRTITGEVKIVTIANNKLSKEQIIFLVFSGKQPAESP